MRSKLRMQVTMPFMPAVVALALLASATLGALARPQPADAAISVPGEIVKLVQGP